MVPSICIITRHLVVLAPLHSVIDGKICNSNLASFDIFPLQEGNQSFCSKSSAFMRLSVVIMIGLSTRTKELTWINFIHKPMVMFH